MRDDVVQPLTHVAQLLHLTIEGPVSPLPRLHADHLFDAQAQTAQSKEGHRKGPGNTRGSYIS